MTRAIILAAGRPSFFSGPICNVDISGQRLLDIQISCLRNTGVEDITLVSGFEANQIERSDIEIVHNEDWKTTGSLCSLSTVSKKFAGDSDVLIVYGDTIFEPDVIRSALRSPGPVAPVCFLDRNNFDQYRFREYAIVDDGVIKRVTESPSPDGIRTVFTGLLCVKSVKCQTLKNYLEDGSFNSEDHVGTLVERLCEAGLDLFPVLIEHGWTEIVSSRSYRNALNDTTFIEKVIEVHTDWTKRSERYNQLDWVNNDALLSCIANLAVKLKPRRILDVGTGTGKVLQALKDCIGDGEFWGVDYSQAMLDRITNKESFTLKCTDAETMHDVPSRYFDLVTARMVFHHINDPAFVLNNISKILRSGGYCLICEGVPPSLRTIEWYTEMFRYKEERKTLTEVDLIGWLLHANFEDIHTHTVIMKRCSLNNWLDNSGIPDENIAVIKQMHFQAPPYVRDDYEMEFTDDDCFMTWRFAVTFGRLVGTPGFKRN